MERNSMLKIAFIRIAAALVLLAGAAALAWPGGAQAAALIQTTSILDVDVDSLAKSGLPGSSVVYNFTVQNTGATDETVTITTTPSGLGIISAPSSVFVAASTSASVQVALNLSAGAVPGSSEGITVSFTPGTGTGVSVLVTTTVSAPPTAAPTTPPGAARPLVVVSGYYLDKDTIAVGDSFKLFVTLRNDGTMNANNLILSFVNESFLPQETGGVVALGSLATGSKRDISQRFLVSAGLAGQPIGTVPVSLTYSDANGTSYSESFSITLQLRVFTGAAKPTATPTAMTVQRPQLVIAAYQTDLDPLQPGLQFGLDMDITNLGNADARAVTMVLGGGVTADPSGTPVPGGVQGGSGDLTTFAPIGSSNLVYLSDLAAGGTVRANTRLIVNVSANPGAYPLKVSFVYTDPRGIRLVDDQVITLLVFQLPLVEVNYYRDPGLFYSGQMTTLPLQVVNLGRKVAVLGNMTVSAPGVEIQNNTTLVGSLDPGGFYTLDASLVPPAPGPLELNIVINYTDDFNQARQVMQTLILDVQDGAVFVPEDPGINGPGGFPVDQPVMVEESFWQKVLRFVKGLIGLDSAQPQNVPIDGIPVDQPIKDPAIIDGSSAPVKGP